MSMMLQGGPFKAPVAGLHRFSVKQYQKMIENGVITEDDDLELLEGYLVEKMSRNAPHDGGLDLMRDALYRLLPVDWWMRVQEGVALRDSVPEPDIAVVRGNARTYLKRHPAPADVGVVMEISDSSLDNDRDDKTRIYARAGLPIYWIVNLVDRQVEVYEQPSGPTPNPCYASIQVFKPGDVVRFVLDGNVIGTIPVADLLP